MEYLIVILLVVVIASIAFGNPRYRKCTSTNIRRQLKIAPLDVILSKIPDPKYFDSALPVEAQTRKYLDIRRDGILRTKAEFDALSQPVREHAMAVLADLDRREAGFDALVQDPGLSMPR